MDIHYTIIVEVNGEAVFESTYLDTSSLEEDLYKAEQAVERYIEADGKAMELDRE